MENKSLRSGKILSSEGFKSIVAAIICALVGILIGFIVLLIINAENAPKAISVILKNFMYFKKPHQRLYYFGSTLVQSVPLILCGLSVLFAYKAGLFNIGVGGQYTIGIGISLWCALAWHLPWYVCVLFAVLASALWGALAGAFKALFNVNEVIACIMLNWIGLYIVNVLMHNDTVMNLTLSESYSVRKVSPGSLIPSLGLSKLFHDNNYVTIAVPIAIVVAIVVAVVLNRTKFGYELIATGLNKHAAKYAGMKEKMNIILTMAIAGGLAGLASSLFYLTDMLAWKQSSSVPAMGFNGIAVAFLGGLNPIGVVFAGYFIQHITLGGSFIDTRFYNSQIADLISSIIIYACAFVLFLKDVLSKVAARKQNKAASLEETAASSQENKSSAQEENSSTLGAAKEEQ